MFGKILLLLSLLLTVTLPSDDAFAQSCPLGDTPITLTLVNTNPFAPYNYSISAREDTGRYPATAQLLISHPAAPDISNADVSYFPFSLAANRKVISAAYTVFVKNINQGPITAQFSAYGTTGHVTSWAFASIAAGLAASRTSPLYSATLVASSAVTGSVPAAQVDQAVLSSWGHFAMAIHQSNTSALGFANFYTHVEAQALRPTLVLQHCARP